MLGGSASLGTFVVAQCSVSRKPTAASFTMRIEDVHDYCKTAEKDRILEDDIVFVKMVATTCIMDVCNLTSLVYLQDQKQQSTRFEGAPRGPRRRLSQYAPTLPPKSHKLQQGTKTGHKAADSLGHTQQSNSQHGGRILKVAQKHPSTTKHTNAWTTRRTAWRDTRGC